MQYTSVKLTKKAGQQLNGAAIKEWRKMRNLEKEDKKVLKQFFAVDANGRCES